MNSCKLSSSGFPNHNVTARISQITASADRMLTGIIHQSDHTTEILAVMSCACQSESQRTGAYDPARLAPDSHSYASSKDRRNDATHVERARSSSWPALGCAASG